MKKFMEKIWEKKNSKKGFTLVELIVVLVILGILVAITVPAMIGWINRAKDKQAEVECRAYYLAAQTLASEQYATDPDADEVSVTEAQKLAFPDDDDRVASSITVSAGKVTDIASFAASNEETYTYDETDGWSKDEKKSE